MSSMFGSPKYAGPTGGNVNLKGTGYKQIVSPQFTKEQMNLFKQMFSQTGPESFLGKLAGGDQGQFEDLERPALQQFSGLQGGLASRFSGMGGLGARKSSGFSNTASSAASDFAQQLQAQRLEIQRQAMQDLMGLSSNLLGQRPYENIFAPKQQSEPGFFKQLLMGLAGGVGQGAGMAGRAALGGF